MMSLELLVTKLLSCERKFFLSTEDVKQLCDNGVDISTKGRAF